MCNVSRGKNTSYHTNYRTCSQATTMVPNGSLTSITRYHGSLPWYLMEVYHGTDQVQPVDRGMGQHNVIKLEMGNEMDQWLEDDDNLALWEGDDGAKLSASDRRVLLAHWYFNATKKALKGNAKWAYFAHAGALLFADGSDDHLVKLEGAPAGYKLVVPAPDN